MTTMATPGATSSVGSMYRLANASLSIAPQLASLAEPRPRNSMPAWMTTATPNICAAWMIVGACTTGRMWRRTIRRSFRPETRAASTYSSSRTEVTEARTRRKTPGARMTPSTVMAALASGPIAAMATSNTMIAGAAITRLATQLNAASTQPR